MVRTLQLDDRQVCLEKPVRILSLLSQQKQKLFRPPLFEELTWINNPRCPLVNLIEVDSRVVPVAVWSERPVRDGMVSRKMACVWCSKTRWWKSIKRGQTRSR